MARKTALVIRIPKEELYKAPRAPIRPSKRHKDKTKDVAPFDSQEYTHKRQTRQGKG